MAIVITALIAGAALCTLACCNVSAQCSREEERRELEWQKDEREAK